MNLMISVWVWVWVWVFEGSRILGFEEDEEGIGKD